MEFEGIVYRVMTPVKGTGARGEWVRQEVVFEMPKEFNRKVCVSFWGERVQDIAGMKEGDKFTVAANVESREYSGKWYTDVRCWRISRVASSENAPAAMSEVPGNFPPISSVEVESSAAEYDDLPF